MTKMKNYKHNRGRITFHLSYILSLLFFFVLNTPCFASHGSQTKNILVLHSYHQSHAWTDNIMRGIQTVIDSDTSNFSLYIEYMDTKRHPPKESFKRLSHLYELRYQDISFDVIIVSDNHALDFLLAQRSKLFPHAPIVFCGINGYTDSLIAGHKEITGIVESLNIKGTIELALSMHPQTKQIIVISDRTLTGENLSKQVRKVMPAFSDTVTFSELIDVTAEELQENLQRVQSDSVILPLVFFQDRLGNKFSDKQFIPLIANSSDLPLYSMWEHYMGIGVLGGMVESGIHQGTTAAQMALKILHGESADNIPILTDIQSIPMFDYTQMDRVALSRSKLPSESIVINTPFSFYEKYKQLTWTVALIISILFVLVVMLIMHVILRKRVLKTLQHERAALRNSLAEAQRFSTALDEVSAYIYMKDSQSRYVYANRLTLELFACSADELLGRDDSHFFPPDDVKHLREVDQRVFAGEQTFEEIEVNVAESERRVYWDIKTPIYTDSEQKTIWGLLGISTDITDQKREQDKYRRTIEISIDGFWTTDVNGRILNVNDAYCRMSGYSRDELLNMSIMDIEVFNSSEEIEGRIQNVIKNGSDRFETKHLHKNGNVLSIEISTTYTPESGGMFFVFIRDITEHKKAEEDKKKMEVKLQQAYKMEAIGTLAGGIAHDFNNLLGTILGYTDLAKDDVGSDSHISRYLEKALYAGYKAKDLVKQILAFSRQAEVERMIMQPAPIIKEAIKLLTSTIPSTIEIQQNIDPKSGVILADPIHLHQILMNLCTNAFHAMEETGGRLEIILNNVELTKDDILFEFQCEAGHYVELTVKDSGSGINPEVKDKIFEPYFTTKGIGRGTGMGLAIIHGIVISYGGMIKVESDLGKGTAFHIYLPVAENEVAAVEETDKETIGGKEHILFIDDDKLLAEMGQDMIERMGYTVSVRNSSLEALEVFQNQPEKFDLVITDQTMPGMTGAELARQMLQIRPDTPIILCTGYSSIISEEKSKVIGIKEFALKPLIKKDIAKLIRKVLDAS